ncbi:MAG: hypothetical protein NO076_03940 [Sulfolobales archaeon]|nr:hypothetical protein [Sulfolobales archaeon]
MPDRLQLQVGFIRRRSIFICGVYITQVPEDVAAPLAAASNGATWLAVGIQTYGATKDHLFERIFRDIRGMLISDGKGT